MNDHSTEQRLMARQIPCEHPGCFAKADSIVASTVTVPYGIAACERHRPWAIEERDRRMAPIRPEGT